MAEQTQTSPPVPLTYDDIQQYPPGGLAYANGTLWFPVRKLTASRDASAPSESIIPPLFYKKDFGGMMPVIRVRIPDVWDSAIIPYENIVSFTLTTLADKQTEGHQYECQLTFLDQTPIFVEEMLRKAKNNEKSPGGLPSIKLSFGWRFGRSIPTDIENAFAPYGHIKDNMYLSQEFDLMAKNTSWKYSNFGVMIDLQLIGRGSDLLENMEINTSNFPGADEGINNVFAGLFSNADSKSEINKAKQEIVQGSADIVGLNQTIYAQETLLKGNSLSGAGKTAVQKDLSKNKDNLNNLEIAKTAAISGLLTVSETTVDNILSRIFNSIDTVINTSPVAKLSQFPYKCMVMQGSKIDSTTTWNNLIKYQNASVRFKSIKSFLNDVCQLFSANKDGSRLGNVLHFISPTPITSLNSTGASETFIPIYFYESFNATESNEYIPQIVYPDYESPIINFQPTLNTENMLIWSNRTKIVKDDGNQETKTVDVPTSTAGVSTASSETGTAAKKEAPTAKQAGAANSPPAKATLQITIPGDPLFNNLNIFQTIFEVIYKDIRQEGILKEKNYWDNFKGLSSVFAAKLTPFSGMPGGQSPFNGVYKLTGVTHKITAGNGYQTDMNFIWTFDDYLKAHTVQQIVDEKKKADDEDTQRLESTIINNSAEIATIKETIAAQEKLVKSKSLTAEGKKAVQKDLDLNKTKLANLEAGKQSAIDSLAAKNSLKGSTGTATSSKDYNLFRKQ